MGVGDYFNVGFSVGQFFGFSLEVCFVMGVCILGYYVCIVVSFLIDDFEIFFVNWK